MGMSGDLEERTKEGHRDDSRPSFGLRTAFAAIGLGIAASLGLTGCGGGGGNGGGNGGCTTCPDPNEDPSVSYSPTPTQVEEGDSVRHSVNGNDTDGTVERFFLDADGNGTFEIQQGTPIDTTIAYDQPGTVTAGAKVRDNEGAESPTDMVDIEVTEAPEPATLVAHLRNLTQDGEPFVRGEGQITYTIGNEEFTSQDSVVVELEEGTYEVFAEKDGFYQPFAIIKERGQGKFEQLEQRDREDQSSAIQVNGDRTIDIYLIREDDIQSLGYSIGDVATIIDNPNAPPEGTDRYTSRTITAWIDRNGSDATPPSQLEQDVETVLTSTGRDGLQSVTDGYFTINIQDGGSQPSEPYLQIQFKQDLQGGAVGNHGEDVNENNEIGKSIARFDVDAADKKIVLEELFQGLGARRDIGNSLADNITDQGQEYNTFGHRLGKILYWFNSGTDINQ